MNFCKMNGAGNDFIIIDNREAGMNESELSALAAHLCERRMSIGADGLIAVETARGSGDFRMRFFNAVIMWSSESRGYRMPSWNITGLAGL